MRAKHPIWVQHRDDLEDKALPNGGRSNVVHAEKKGEEPLENVRGGRLTGVYAGGDEDMMLVREALWACSPLGHERGGQVLLDCPVGAASVDA